MEESSVFQALLLARVPSSMLNAERAAIRVEEGRMESHGLGARVPVTKATRTLGHLLLLHRNDVDGDAVELCPMC